ncbi:Cyclic AMP-dependent transcription factor ATF-1 [Phytophthora nicotianae]|uniref:Cyclic AMP-dependent transcription factor ATF-1 n=1 Tax=Phytophthora nicotianae TaxID=4792 RepID=A0A0W8CVI0_PHYNI|nr:Cyclic AMP-dependent transcription factor ATF-1 [Phytophthora nicotianae]
MNIAQSSLALLLIVAAASNTDASYLRKLGGTTIATNVKTYAAYGDYAPAMLAAVNKQRATKGLSPLCLNKKLHSAAQRHSDDMAAKDYMAHDGSDGSTMSERITQAGYDWSAVAENVAAGQVDVDAVMVAWINSPEHLENIMGDYTMFAPGYAFNKEGTYQHYWTQDFGTGETEQCDGATTSGSTTVQDATQNVDVVQGEAETEAPTPAPTTVTDAPATEAPIAPATEAPITETEAPVTPAPTTPTPETPVQADCQSNF